MNTSRTQAAASAQQTPSPWSPFRHATFTVVWIATVVSNIGGWMYSAASGWLMTSLNADPLIVSMVQVATTLPMFLFAVPAGALADIVDRRKFLVVGGDNDYRSLCDLRRDRLALVSPRPLTFLLFTS